MNKKQILAQVKAIDIPELKDLQELIELPGAHINMDVQLPNGQISKILNDQQNYYAAEVVLDGGDKCLGIAADQQSIAIFYYSPGGEDALLIGWWKV